MLCIECSHENCGTLLHMHTKTCMCGALFDLYAATVHPIVLPITHTLDTHPNTWHRVGTPKSGNTPPHSIYKFHLMHNCL